MQLQIDRAQVADIEELIGLYISVYGNDYPLEIGANRQVMKKAILDHEKIFWFVMRDVETHTITGSTVFELDLHYKIGKVIAVAVSKNYRGNDIATRLIGHGTDIVLNQAKLVNSLYATARTISVASQRMFLKNNYLPLGIFPNSRKIKSYETLTLLGKFQEGVLERRAPQVEYTTSMLPIVSTLDSILGVHHKYIEKKAQEFSFPSNDEGVIDGYFEFIDAPNFVSKRFDQIFANDEEASFFPFHRPNLLISSKLDDVELYATFSKKDHYCVIITSNRSIVEMGNKFKRMIFEMKELGIYYVEILVRTDAHTAIDFLVYNRFLPSAIYPAMKEANGIMQDYILLTRTMVPIDFSELSIDKAFKPFVTNYSKEWICLHLDSFGVF